MKKGILGFLLGIIVMFVYFHSNKLNMHTPTDQTALLPESKRQGLEEAGLGFLKNAYGYRSGDVKIFTPHEKDHFLAYIMVGSEVWPSQIIIYDKNKDEIADYIGILDKNMHSMTVFDENNDGVWERWTYSKKPKDAPGYADTNLDGQPDYKDDGKEIVMVFVQGGWRKYRKENNKEYADINGEFIEIERDMGGNIVISPNKSL